MLIFGAGDLCTDGGRKICKHGGRPVYGSVSKFLFFYCLVFSTKYFRKSLKVFKKVFERGMEGKDFFSKIFCYLFGAFVHDQCFDSLSINTYLINF